MKPPPESKGQGSHSFEAPSNESQLRKLVEAWRSGREELINAACDSVKKSLDLPNGHETTFPVGAEFYVSHLGGKKLFGVPRLFDADPENVITADRPIRVRISSQDYDQVRVVILEDLTKECPANTPAWVSKKSLQKSSAK